MQCQSCKEDVLAKFAFAISQNSCPYCGGEIVSAVVKATLNDLSMVLNQAQDHMDQIEEWLFTNYALRKIKEDEIVINKNDIPPTVLEGERPAKISKGNRIRRAGDDNDVPATSGMDNRSALDFIKKGGAGGLADPSLYVGTDDEGNEVDLAAEAGNGLRGNELNEMSNLFGNGISTDPKEVAQHDSYMAKLKKLQRG